jgi:hypothetical protein
MSSISSILLVFVALLINYSSTAPSLLTRQTPQRYYLRTAAIPSDLTNTNDTGTLKNNLYITAYHVGAGFNNVGLTSNISEAVSGSLNSTIIDPNSGETTWISSLPPIISNGEPDYWDMCAVTSGDLSTSSLSSCIRRLLRWDGELTDMNLRLGLYANQSRGDKLQLLLR